MELHQPYRAFAFLGKEVATQKDRTPFSSGCTQDVIAKGTGSVRLPLSRRHLNDISKKIKLSLELFGVHYLTTLKP